jgi:hypothetical protein
MNVRFDLEGYRPVIVLTPDTNEERIILSTFLRFEANVLSASVEKKEDGRIGSLTLRAGSE